MALVSFAVGRCVRTVRTEVTDHETDFVDVDNTHPDSGNHNAQGRDERYETSILELVKGVGFHILS